MKKYNFDIPEKMQSIIESYTVGLGATGVIGGLIGPGADLIIIGPSWIKMTIELAEEADEELSEQSIKKIVLAVLTGAGAFMAGTKAASTGLAWITAIFTGGVSLFISAAANASLNALFTASYGRAVSQYFLLKRKIGIVDLAVPSIIALIGLDLGLPIDQLPEGSREIAEKFIELGKNGRPSGWG
jgi:hypothetical protein